MPVSASRMLAAGATSCIALAAAAPAMAQQMSYEEQVYQQTQTGGEAPASMPTPEPEFVSQPVVQPLPSGQPGDDPATETAAGAGWTGSDGHHHPLPPGHMGYTGHTGYPGYAVPQVIYSQAPVYQAAYPAIYQPVPQPVDRESWIGDCRAYLDQHRQQKERGGVTGGVLGAIAGGVIGNRVADGERLGGTLIGAGVGGLAGLFIGQAIARGQSGSARKDCDRWYADYQASYSSGQMWSSGYVVVPQTTVVIYQSPPMVPVVREIVREEWVEEEVASYRKVTPPPAPAPKRRYIKSKAATKPVKGR